MCLQFERHAGDMGLIPASERSSGGGNGCPFRYSHLENPMDRGPGGLQSMGSQSWTQLSMQAYGLNLILRAEHLLTELYIMNGAHV